MGLSSRKSRPFRNAPFRVLVLRGRILPFVSIKEFRFAIFVHIVTCLARDPAHLRKGQAVGGKLGYRVRHRS
jgi:hypothetical protein